MSGRPAPGDPPTASLVPITAVDSPPLKAIVRRMDVDSLNFYAEVLGKLLARRAAGAPGTIAKAPPRRGVRDRPGRDSIEHHDSSGLSYANRVRTNEDRAAPVGGRREAWGAGAAGWPCRAAGRARSGPPATA